MIIDDEGHWSGRRILRFRTCDGVPSLAGVCFHIATTPWREHGDDRELERSRLQAGACDEART